MAIKLLIADDHRILREGLVALVQHEADMQVVGQAADGREAVEMCKAHHPDAVVMDLGLPVLNGIDATREILSQAPSTRIVALSARGEQAIVQEAVRAGVCGYVLKTVASEDLLSAIRSAMRGEHFFSPG